MPIESLIRKSCMCSVPVLLLFKGLGSLTYCHINMHDWLRLIIGVNEKSSATYYNTLSVGHFVFNHSLQ